MYLLFLLNAACIEGEETNTNFIAFSLTQQGLEPMIYHTQTIALPMRCLII